MLTNVFIFSTNRSLKKRLVLFFKEHFGMIPVSLFGSYSKLDEALKNDYKGILIVEKKSLIAAKKDFTELDSRLNRIDKKAILVVEKAADLESYDFFYRYKSVYLILSKDFSPKGLLSYIKMLYVFHYYDDKFIDFDLQDLININTGNIKYRHNLLDILNHTNEGMWFWDLEKDIFYLSDLFRQSLGYGDEQLKNSLEQFTNLIHPEDKKSFRETLNNYLHHIDEHFNSEVRLRNSDGDYKWYIFRGYAVWEDGVTPKQMIGFQLDINNMKTHIEMLENLALTDPLTNLPNRNLLYDRIARGIVNSSRNHRMLGLLFLDLDDFKSYNDTFGHKAGDAVLIETAARLQTCVRKIDTVGRLHGDEFVIVLPFLSTPEDIALFTDRLSRAFKKPMLIDGQEHIVSCSVGSSLYPKDGDSAEALLEKADISMYKRKNIHKTLYKK